MNAKAMLKSEIIKNVIIKNVLKVTYNKSV